MLLIAGIAACTSGKKALDKGNYEESTLKAINRLRSSPDNDKAAATLKEAYPLALSDYQMQINRLRGSNEQFRWERVVNAYERINNMHDEIRRCPACLKVIPSPQFYSQELSDAKNLAADERYTAGDAAMKMNSRQAAKEAFNHFQVANNYVPGFKDAQARMEQAREYATLRVVVEQIPVTSRLFGVSNEFFQQKVFEYISTNRRMNDFVRFYTPQQANAEQLKYPDQIIRLQFDDFVVGQTFMNSKEEIVTSKDSVKVGEVTVEGKKVAVYNKVTAKMTSHKKTVSSRGVLDMQIFDPAANRVVYQNKFPGEFVWFSEWASFNGDERALNDAQKKMCKQREVPPPPPQDLFVEFCKPIYDQVTNQIRRFYKEY